MMVGHKQKSEVLQVLQLCVACVLLLSAIFVSRFEGSELSMDYYKHSCPDMETIVKGSLLPIFLTDPQSPSAFLRLLFHDCQVQGCDASILLDSNNTLGIKSEMESYKNFGIRKRESISDIKSVVEAYCPGQVSCADILVLAAREAVAHSGGPHIPILLGRKDSSTSSNLIADEELPSPSLGVDGTLRMFMAKGMSLEETIAIVGAHTIGVGHCINIAHRLYNMKERHQEVIDPGFEAFLRLKCPTQVPLTNDTFIVNDLTTLIFDNQYYSNIISGHGLFTVDSALSRDPRTAQFVARFALDQIHFFQMFSSAFVKLSSVVNPDAGGEIRRQCNRVN